MSREMYDDNYPIAVLIEELRNEDVQFRLNSIKKLSTIAIALGPEKTRTQLIPFLTESVYDEDDVLVALTEQLIKLIPHIGGPSQIKVLLSLLETLGTVEETAVREKAVQVLRQMAPYFSFEDMRDHYFPLVQRFATAQWFATKISATGLFAVVYPRVDETLRSRILDMVVDLARDELNTVRTAIATKLGELVMIMLGQQKMDEPQKLEDPDEFEFGDSENVDPGVVDEAYKLPVSSSYPPLDFKVERDRVIEKLIPVITMLWPDDNDTVRLMTFESAVLIAKGLASTGTEEPDRYLIKLVHYAAVDKSWRVRCVVANKFPMIIEAFGSKVIADELYAVFIKLLKDNESEVKVLSVNRAKDFAYLMAGVPLPPEMSDESTSSVNGGGHGQQNWTGGDSPAPVQEKVGVGVLSANNAITTASTLLSCGETTLGSQLQAKVASINGHSKAQSSLAPVSADTDNFIFKFNSLSNSLSCYRDQIPRMKEAEKMVVDVDESDSNPISNCPILMQQLIPTLKELQMDTSPHVRITLANVVMQLVPLCGRDITIKDLMPIILSLLKDECQEVSFYIRLKPPIRSDVPVQVSWWRENGELKPQVSARRRPRPGYLDWRVVKNLP
ncbi:hypothetical protein Ciccas_005661 [Cichlidogyrus casuarinus]|uniref:Uncharacterized protein n=1 Tax=Cichlidogyrus casuarinus TaxID=1844966 RepID=A0ABD2Q810_9PLAT